MRRSAMHQEMHCKSGVQLDAGEAKAKAELNLNDHAYPTVFHTVSQIAGPFLEM
jgi:hypothetical protein